MISEKNKQFIAKCNGFDLMERLNKAIKSETITLEKKLEMINYYNETHSESDITKDCLELVARGEL